MNKGYIHVYTGNGKGKTTAAFGLAVRAACAGKKVYVGQFIKDMAYSESAISSFLPQIKIEQLGKGCFIDKEPTLSDRKAALSALEKCAENLRGEFYDVVILDEVFIALYFDLLTTCDLIEVLKKRGEHVEVVLTGRYAPLEIMNYADLVTEMKEVKHYFNQGVLSRKGIDC